MKEMRPSTHCTMQSSFLNFFTTSLRQVEGAVRSASLCVHCVDHNLSDFTWSTVFKWRRVWRLFLREVLYNCGTRSCLVTPHNEAHWTWQRIPNHAFCRLPWLCNSFSSSEKEEAADDVLHRRCRCTQSARAPACCNFFGLPSLEELRGSG